MVDAKPAEGVDAGQEGFVGGFVAGHQDLGVGGHGKEKVGDFGDVRVEGRSAVFVFLAPFLQGETEVSDHWEGARQRKAHQEVPSANVDGEERWKLAARRDSQRAMSAVEGDVPNGWCEL